MATKRISQKEVRDTVSADHAAAVTPHDTNELAFITRALFIGGAGELTVKMASGSNVTFAAVPAGTLLPIQCYIVLDTGTDATGIVALF